MTHPTTPPPDDTVHGNGLTEERRAFLRKIGRKGGLSRAKSFTSDFQRRARACVSHEANVANGRKGGIAYARNRRNRGKRRLVSRKRVRKGGQGTGARGSETTKVSG